MEPNETSALKEVRCLFLPEYTRNIRRYIGELLDCVWGFIFSPRTQACTNILVTKGATQDGSVMVTYSCDGEWHPILRYTPAADYEPEDSLEITDWSGDEHQLVIAESTFDGRPELQNPDGLLHYWDLMQLALQRAKTAREAIKVMTDLVADYGYRSTGESISIADPNEVWLLEIIGPGPGGKGAVWVAQRIPDGYVSCHANKARIGEFPLNDPENCWYSENVISLAVEKGYYDPASGEPFVFHEVYGPSTPRNLRWADTRVWSIMRRVAPSNLKADYHRAVEGAEPYPLWIKPDKKLSLADVMGLMRDHYEDTDFDMTKGIDAGPFGSPYRWRPLNWMVDSVEYASASNMPGNVRFRRSRWALRLYRNRAPGCPIRSEECSGTELMTAIPPATSRFIAASMPCPNPTLWAA